MSSQGRRSLHSSRADSLHSAKSHHSAPSEPQSVASSKRPPPPPYVGRADSQASSLASLAQPPPTPPPSRTEDPSVPWKYLYIVLGVAIVGLIAAGLIGYYSASCAGVSASTQKTTTSPTPPVAPTLPPTAFFLPKDLSPLSYSLALRVFVPDNKLVSAADANAFRFMGNWSVDFTCVRPTAAVVFSLNGLNLTTSSFKLSTLGAATPGLGVQQSYIVNTVTQMATIPLSGKCVSGVSYRLSLHYQGSLSKTLYGFYRSSYTENGKQKWLGVTQFQPTYARMAFPCWDEPAFKANFSLSLTAPPTLQALGNGIRLSSATQADGWNLTTFSTTPRMSTYLVAFAVADFAYVERYTPDGNVRFRIWARPELKSYLNYAADVGAQALQLYTKLFGIPFPLPKQDMLAVPDFGLGAMENWGLVTYREQSLIYQTSKPTAATTFRSKARQGVALTITHELAHQWFGDLVTMAWWNDAFLNEGFATWIEGIGTDQINMSHRAFDMDDQFVPNTVQVALLADASASSRAVSGSRSASATAAAINSYFDTITYEKGGSVLSMLNFTLGRPLFLKGLNKYLLQYQYANANHNQLWTQLTSVVGQSVRDWNGNGLNVSTFMNTWVEQPGFPLVTANRSGNTITLTQQRFLLSPTASPPPSKYGYQWYIPVWYQAGSVFSKLIWMSPGQTKTIQLSGAAATAPFFLINYKVRGFYRAHYDRHSWLSIKAQLYSNPMIFDVRNRAQFVSDALELAAVGQMSYSDALGILGYLRNERNYIPWKSAAPMLDFFNDMFALDGKFSIYRNYTLNLVANTYAAVTWNDIQDPVSAVLKHYTRSYILDMACRFDMPICTTHAVGYFSAFKTNCEYSKSGSFGCSRAPADLRHVIYCSGIAHGTSEDWAFVWDLYTSEQVADERDSLMRGLACTTEPWLLRRLLYEGLGGTHIRSQDARFMFQYVGVNPVGRELLWNFLSRNWVSINSQYGQSFGDRFIGQIVTAATRGFNTQFQVDELSSFMRQHALGRAAGAFSGALASARTNMAWMTANKGQVLDAMSASLVSH